MTPPAKPSTIDEYLAGVDEPKKVVLEHLRAVIMDVGGLAETISYGMPGFRTVGEHGQPGRVVAGFAAGVRDHCGYYPHSGGVLGRFADELAEWECSSGAVRFTTGHPLPDDLVRRLVLARLAEG